MLKVQELTAHQQMAQNCGLHPNTLAMFQRQKVVPRDVEHFTHDDMVLLQKLAVVMKDPDLIRLQLGRKPKKERDQLLKEADDFKQYKNWERKVIRMFITQYEQGVEVTKAKAMSYLKFRFKKEPTAGLKSRVGVLKRVAAGRFAANAKGHGPV